MRVHARFPLTKDVRSRARVKDLPRAPSGGDGPLWRGKRGPLKKQITFLRVFGSREIELNVGGAELKKRTAP